MEVCCDGKRRVAKNVNTIEIEGKTMVHVDVRYSGKLRCQAVHKPSGNAIQTDAPVDNHGLGESFSPTDLVATAMASCMATIMGIVADRNGVDLSGLKVGIDKSMSATPPRRISRLAVKIEMPIPQDHPNAEMLANAALACPVHKSLHPDIDVPIQWVWQ
jgi:uncharacterized OsmC-like protein